LSNFDDEDTETEDALALLKWRIMQDKRRKLIHEGLSKFNDKNYTEAEDIFSRTYEISDLSGKKFTCDCVAKTKYKLKKYDEALYYWKIALDTYEEELNKLNFSKDEIEKNMKCSNKTIITNVGVTYRRLIKSTRNTGKCAALEKEYQHFLNKYTYQSKSIVVDKKSFTIQHSNTTTSLKLIKKIETKKITRYVKFIDNGLLYTDGSRKPYNLVKINNNSEIEWKIPYHDGIRDICCFDQTFLVYRTKWEQENNSSTSQTILYFIDRKGSLVSDFKFDSYVRYLDYNDNFVIIWSADSKIRLFNTVGDLLWKYHVDIQDIYKLKDISVSDAGLVLFNLDDKICLVDENQNKSLVYILSTDLVDILPIDEKTLTHKELTNEELKYWPDESELEYEAIDVEYLFSWDSIPGNDDERLLRFLKSEFDVDWVKNAIISKSDDEKSILISKDERLAEIVIDVKKLKATLKLNDDIVHNLIIKIENDKFNIYNPILSVCIRVSHSHVIESSKICPNSNYLFFGLNTFKQNSKNIYYLYCLNFNRELIWKVELSFRIIRVHSSHNGDKLLVFCRGTNNSSVLYFIEMGEIMNEYEIEYNSGNVFVKYHNKKELFFISHKNEVLIFDKIGNVLNKIIFGTNVIDFDISVKFDKLVVAASNYIYLFYL